MPGSSRPDLAIPAGAPVALPPGAGAWRVHGGPVEAYLVSEARRRLIAVVSEGGHVFGTAARALSVALVAADDAVLRPDDSDDWRDSARDWIEQAASNSAMPGEAVLAETPEGLEAIGAFATELDARFAAKDAARDRELTAQFAAAPSDGPANGIVAALHRAAEALGGSGASTGRPPAASEFALAPALARRFGLRATQVVLGSGWNADDRGPLLLRGLRDDAVCFAQFGRDGYGIDPAQVDGFAFRLHAPLIDEVGRLKGMARSVLRGLTREWRAIGATALGAALLGLIAPPVSGWIFDAIVPSGDRGAMIAAGLALLGAAAAIALLSAIRQRTILRVRGRGMTAMQAGVADHVLRLPARYFRTVAAGDFAQRIASLEAVRVGMTNVLLSAGLTAIFALAYLGQLFWFDWRLALAGLALTTLNVAATAASRALQARPLALAAERDGKLSSLTHELLEGIAKLRTAAAEERMLARWEAAYASEREAAAAADRIEAHYAAFADAVNLITLAGLFATAGLLAAHELSPGRFIAFLAAFALFQGAFAQLSGALLSLWSIQPLADRAQLFLAAEPEASAGRADPGRLSGRIAVSGLSFAYDGATAPLIDGLDFELEPGEHLAIVGGSGSGKSTVLRLLLGFEAALTGSIAFDGQDFAHLDPARVRSQIGVVLQSSQLFAGSIQDNIRGASDAGIAECQAAAEAAGLGPDLKQFPMGMHTPLTEGSGTLSGGQRQRILIARALAGSPRLLFLDEATSALDNATQAVVARTMDALHATRITIAHRLSTVRNADRIAVLERGRFVETGDFATLMARGGAFAALARRQLLED